MNQSANLTHQTTVRRTVCAKMTLWTNASESDLQAIEIHKENIDTLRHAPCFMSDNLLTQPARPVLTCLLGGVA